MSRRRPSALLAARLRATGIVPAGAELSLGRLYCGRIQRSQGAWSWTGEWEEHGNVRYCGSQYPMLECATAPGLIIGLEHGSVTVDPVLHPVAVRLSCGHEGTTERGKADPRGASRWCPECRRDRLIVRQP